MRKGIGVKVHIVVDMETKNFGILEITGESCWRWKYAEAIGKANI